MYIFQEKKKEFVAFEAKSTKELFQKWGMVKMSVKLYSYDKYFDLSNKVDFVSSLLQNDLGQNILDGTKVLIDSVPASILNMTFFDRLYSGNVARQCGSIKKCFDEMVGDVLVSDELRKLLLVEESEFFNLYSTVERQEFIFKIFQHFVIGGYCNQYEDNVKVYTDTTKVIYKGLLHVFKNKESQMLEIGSIILNVKLEDANGKQFFPGQSESSQNFCYMIINPEKREIIVWTHFWDL